MANHTTERNLDILFDQLAPKPFGKRGKAWVAVLILFTLLGLYFYVVQLDKGLTITGLGDYTTWGIYVSNFVFFVAISLVGSLLGAILKLSGAEWRTPLTRIAEIIALAGIIMAGLVIIIDMGRPDRLLNLFIYPRIQSPIVWDVIVITTYLFMSILFLYMPLIPDFAVLAKRMKGIPAWQRKFYKILSVNWRNTDRQKAILDKSIKLLAIIIIPVAFMIHTVTSWLFATTFRPGWDSASVGPYFVAGAFMVGAGSVICAMYILRETFDYGHYFTDKHFDYGARLLLMLSGVYLYFNVNEYFIPAYKMKAYESEHLRDLFVGDLAPLFWTIQIGGMVIPIIILLFRKGRTPLVAFVVSAVVVVGAWFKRFLIVVPTLAHPLVPTTRVPESWLHYIPTIPEWFITIGTFTMSLLIVTLLIRYLPVVPIVKTAREEGLNEEKFFESIKESTDEI